MNAIATDKIISVQQAKYLEGYKIHFEFDDGKCQVVDFEGFLKKASNPMITDYLDLDKFKGFTLREGDIDWNDYELCFPIADLYEGQI